MASIQSLIIATNDPLSVEHAARTAVAAVASLFVARYFGLSETYWAAILTLLVDGSWHFTGSLKFPWESR
jgi:uncharacterized membrane protein YccC